MAVFDVRGDHQLHQSNGAVVHLRLEQAIPQRDLAEAERLRGTAQAGTMRSTEVSGTTRGDELFLVITWNQGAVGEYHGRFNLVGRLTGVTFDRTAPTSQATWFIDRDFRHIG